MNRREFISAGVKAASFATAGAVLLKTNSAYALPANNSAKSGCVLSFFNTHTNETLTTAYKQMASYSSKALTQINKVLRDHRTGDVHAMDPRLMDLLFDLKRLTGTKSPYQVISGYRSPKSNAMLHSASASSGVANNSYHMKGMAIDIRLNDLSLRELHSAAMSLKRGGVGLYTSSDFVHVDVGPVRHWGA